MTDRINSLTVVLSADTRDDDCECIKNAITMIKGVLCVDLNVRDMESYIAVTRERTEIENKLWKALRD